MTMEDKYDFPVICKTNWLLKDNSGKPICNFIPSVIKVTKVRNNTNYREIITLKLFFSNTDYVETEVSSADLDHIRWSEIDSRCIVNSEYRMAGKYIVNSIRAGISKVRVEEKTGLDRLGIHHINENIIFVAGDRVLSRSPAEEVNSDFILEKLPFHLDIDESITPFEAFKGMCELIALCPEIGKFLVAHTISGITRAAFKEAGFTPSAVMAIIGKSGTLKSHYVPHMVQLYNRSEYIGPVTRLNSTERYIEDMLCDYSECTVVIDDLHTGESKSIMRKSKNTAEEIIRRISDDTGRGRKDGKASIQHHFGGNAVFIGEYLFGKDSTVPRVLMVNLSKAPNGGILDVYQRKKPLLVSTFYYYFIQWYVNEFDNIRNMIDENLTRFRKKNAEAIVHGRFLDIQFYLQLSYGLFLEFCIDSGLCSEQEAQDELACFSEQLVKLIQFNQTRLDARDSAKEVDYLRLIREMYKRGKFKVSPDKDRFNPDDYDGIIYYDCLCLRGERVDDVIRKIIPGVQREDWVDFLLESHALKTVENKNTIQIAGCSGRRFYAIRLEKLK